MLPDARHEMQLDVYSACEPCALYLHSQHASYWVCPCKTICLHFAGRKLFCSFLWDAFVCYARGGQSNWVDDCSKTVFVLTKSWFILFCFVFVKVADVHAED